MKEKKVYEVLKELGIPMHLRGYECLKHAILTTLEYPDMMYYITKDLYPDVAATCGLTASQVERNIRHSITWIFNNTAPETLHRFFGNGINMNTGKVSNAHFIAAVVEYIRMEDK